MEWFMKIPLFEKTRQRFVMLEQKSEASPKRFALFASYITLVVGGLFAYGTPALATTTVSLPTISITASTTNPNVYTQIIDTSILNSIGGSFNRDVRMTEVVVGGGQCWSLSGGTGALDETFTVETDVTHSHAGITTSGAQPCNTSGYYYHIWWKTGSSTIYYATYYYNANTNKIVTTPQLDNQNQTNQYNTRFTDFQFVQNNPDDFAVDVEYFIDSSEVNEELQNRNPKDIIVRLSAYKYDDTSQTVYGDNVQTSFRFYETLTFDATTTQNTLFDHQFQSVVCASGDANGTSYRVESVVNFYNQGSSINNVYPFPESYIYNTSFFNKDSGTGECNLVSQENEEYNAVVPQNDAPVVYEECGITNLGGCINNSFRFLFIPSNESLNNLLATKDILDTRIPFVYTSDIRTIADEIFNTAQAQTLDVELNLGFGTVPLINESMIENAPQANTVRTLLSYALWIMFAMGAYRMALGIHNKETT